MLHAFSSKTRNTIKNITWSDLNHPPLSKRSTGCIRQDLGREHNILLSVTHILCVSHVRHSVSRCVKVGVVLRQACSDSQWTVLMGCPAISTNVRRYQTQSQMTIDSYASAVLGVVILSVCPPLRLSVCTRVLCD